MIIGNYTVIRRLSQNQEEGCLWGAAGGLMRLRTTSKEIICGSSYDGPTAVDKVPDDQDSTRREDQWRWLFCRQLRISCTATLTSRRWQKPEGSEQGNKNKLKKRRQTYVLKSFHRGSRGHSGEQASSWTKEAERKKEPRETTHTKANKQTSVYEHPPPGPEYFDEAKC